MRVWPTDVEAVDLAGRIGAAPACATLAWRHAGVLRLTVVAKASFEIVNDQPMRSRSPDELALRDTHVDGNPAAPLWVAGDLVPFKARTDVTFVGHAYAPNSVPTYSSIARLGIYRGHKIFDRSLHVYGDRDANGQVVPFQRVPLTHERALVSPDNPVGSPVPNVVDARGPAYPGAFAPLAGGAAARVRLLRGAMPPAIAPGPDVVIDLPTDFDWGYFQSAPIDQQAPTLRGDEWIVLDGIDAGTPRIKTQLPRVRARARVYALQGGASQEVPMALDTVAIDGDRMVVTTTFRGTFPVSGTEALASFKVLCGVETNGVELAWPSVDRPPQPAAPPSRPQPGAGLLSDVTEVPKDVRAMTSPRFHFSQKLRCGRRGSVPNVSMRSPIMARKARRRDSPVRHPTRGNR